MAPGFVPPAGRFTVLVDSTAATVSSVAFNASNTEELTLTLATAVTEGQSITVAYTQSTTASEKARDRYGNLLDSFTAQPVRTDNTAPMFESATVQGDRLLITFDEALSTSVALPDASAFTVPGGARTDITVSAVDAISGTLIRVTLSEAVTKGDTVTVSYNETNAASNSGGPLQDAAGNQVADFSGAVTNTSGAPEFVSATINGNTLVATFDEALDTAAPNANAFSVRFSGSDTRSGQTISIGGAQVTLTFGRAATPNEQADNFSYNKGNAGTNPLQDPAGHDVDTFSGQPVDNITDGTAPSFVNARIEGAKITVTFDEPLDANSVPGNTAFGAKVDALIHPTLPARVPSERHNQRRGGNADPGERRDPRRRDRRPDIQQAGHEPAQGRRRERGGGLQRQAGGKLHRHAHVRQRDHQRRDAGRHLQRAPGRDLGAGGPLTLGPGSWHR